MKISGEVDRQHLQSEERGGVLSPRSSVLEYDEELTEEWRRPAPPPGPVASRRRREEVSDATEAQEDEATLRELLMRYIISRKILNPTNGNHLIK